MKKEVVLLLLLLIPLSFAICEGCLMGEKCINVGEQRLTKEDGYEVYCSSQKLLERAKELGEPCSSDYECKDYYCDMVCKRLESGSSSLVMPFLKFLILGIIIIIVVYFLERLIRPKNKPKPIKKQKTIKIQPKLKKDYDTLEKNLSKSVEEVSQLSKKK